MAYATAEEWRNAAMLRDSGIDSIESESRREIARQHHLQEGTEPDADALADYELYIQGKMEIEEYQQYLLFKHGGC